MSSENNLKSERIDEIITSRANVIIKQLQFPFVWKRFYIAGGCLTGYDINDVDIFLPTNFEYIKQVDEPVETIIPDSSSQISSNTIDGLIPNAVLSETPNATTYDSKPWNTQVCRYYYSTLKELVNSFDFAHIQIGVEVTQGWLGEPSISEVYYTDRFVEAQVERTTRYVSSRYPMSSLIRAAKYYQRGLFTKGTYVGCVLSILSDIVSRGFKGYEDFKDQLDAVDLGLLPEEFKDIEQGSDKIISLFHNLDRGETKKSET